LYIIKKVKTREGLQSSDLKSVLLGKHSGLVDPRACEVIMFGSPSASVRGWRDYDSESEGMTPLQGIAAIVLGIILAVFAIAYKNDKMMEESAVTQF